MSILVQDISAWAHVEGNDGELDFRLTEIEIERQTGRTVGSAIAKGIPGQIENIKTGPGARIEIFIESESTDTPWNLEITPQNRVFYGEIVKATQNEEGVVTFEALDKSKKMQNKRVQLNTENPQGAKRVLQDLIDDTFGGYASSLSEAEIFKPYIGDFPDNPTRPWRFGSAKRGDPLIDVIEELLNALGGLMWIDKNGIIRFEEYPDLYTNWVTPLITEIDAGEEAGTRERVLFEASGTASQQGQGAGYVNAQATSTSSADLNTQNEEADAPDLVLDDLNVSTQEEADKQAFNNAVKQDQQRDMGDVTIIGNAAIDLYDHAIIPELDYTFDGLEDVLANDLQQGKYKVDGIVHKVNASDGFLTTLKLSPAMEDTLGRITVGSGAGFGQDRLAQYENKLDSTEISHTNNGDSDESGTIGGFGPTSPSP